MHGGPSRPDDGALAGLVDRARNGARDAEAILCARFAPLIRTFARRRVRSEDTVDEFAQDVLLVVVQALRSGAVIEPERFAGFVLGVCRNVARERARHRDRRASLWEKFGPALVEVLDADAPEMSRDEVARLEDCLSQLSERSRELIRYAYVDELSNVEIAARLALAEGNVRVVRHRTLGALRDCMHPPPDSEGP